MATTLTESSTFTTTVITPDPGEPIKALAGPGGMIRGGFQSLTNRSRSFVDYNLNQPLIYKVRSKCLTTPTVVIEPLGEIFLNFGGNPLKHSDATGATLNINTRVGGIAANTRYYIYAFWTGSSLDFEVNTTVPDARNIFKSTDVTRSLVTTVYSDAIPGVLLYNQEGNTFTYYSRVASGGNRQLSVSGSVSATQAFNAAIPIFSRSILIQTRFQATASSDFTLAGSAVMTFAIDKQLIGGGISTDQYKIGYEASFSYTVGVNGALTLWAAGFTL